MIAAGRRPGPASKIVRPTANSLLRSVALMPETVGEPRTLEERVRDLRLPNKVDLPNRSGGWLPWVLCILLGLTTVSVAARLNSLPSPGPAEERVRAAVGTSPNQEPSPPSSLPQSRETEERVASGSVVLESKGYIIAAHQIRVSPIEVSGLIKEPYVEEGKRL